MAYDVAAHIIHLPHQHRGRRSEELQAVSHTLSLSLSTYTLTTHTHHTHHTHTHTHPHTHSPTTHTLTHTHSPYTHSPTHTHTYPYTHSPTHTLTHTHTCTPTLSLLSLSPHHPLTFLSHKGQRPGKDIHEVGQPVGVLHGVELPNVHHIVLILEYCSCSRKTDKRREERVMCLGICCTVIHQLVSVPPTN